MQNNDAKCASYLCNKIAYRIPISKFNSELRHVEWFFHGYSCELSHYLLKCLKCEEFIKTDYCESHVAYCYFERRDYSEGAAECFLPGNRIGYVDMYDVTRKIPHALCLNINYNDPEIIQLFDEGRRRIDDDDMDVFIPFLRILLRQTPSCYFCGFDYDCFPTERMFVKHMEYCLRQ